MYPYMPPSYKGYYARFVILKCWFDSDRRLKKKENVMKYEIGKTVDFNWEIWEYYCNTDLQYEGTERFTGKIESYDEEKNSYSIRVGDILYQGVKEHEIINKAAEFKHNLTDMKIKIANAALKMRDALFGCDHPAYHEECSKEYDKRQEELYDLMSEYDELEDEYIMLGGEKTTYE